MAQRSTTLKLMARHCAKALDFFDEGAPTDRNMFATGIAAHAVLQVLSQGTIEDPTTIADAVVRELSTKGRAFDGVPEPPLPVDACIRGRDLALAWFEEHGLPVGDLHAEIGLAVDEKWQPVEYSAAAYYRAAIDLSYLDVVEDEESSFTAIVVRDLKTAWPSTETELDSIQMKGQAILAIAHHPEADAVRIEIANLRTRKLYTKTVWLDDDGKAQLEQWKRDLDTFILAAEYRGPDGNRPATPGPGCIACPYIVRCEAARAVVRGTVLDDSPETVALRYAVVDAMEKELGSRLRAHAAEEAIAIPGGVVGYVGKERGEADVDAAKKLAHAWFKVQPEEEHTWDAVHGDVIGLILALDPGVTSLKSVATVLYPFDRADPEWKAKRGELIAQLIKPTVQATFGVFRQ